MSAPDSFEATWNERTKYPVFLEKTVYPAVRSIAGRIDIVFDGKALGRYPVILAPNLVLYRDEIGAALLGYFRDEGVIITTNDFLHTYDSLPVRSTEGEGSLIILPVGAPESMWLDTYRSIL